MAPNANSRRYHEALETLGQEPIIRRMPTQGFEDAEGSSQKCRSQSHPIRPRWLLPRKEKLSRADTKRHWRPAERAS